MAFDLGRETARAPRGVQLSPALRLLGEVLARAGLNTPDGRPLYHYRVTDSEFGRGLELVRGASAFLDQSNRSLCAVFALVTSEWFRRQGTLWRRWQDVGVVPPDVSTTERNGIARAGLDWWGLDIVVREGVERNRNEYLLTLARNGGLPSSLLVGERANAVRRYFEHAMAESLALPWPVARSDYLDIASRCAEDLPASYRDESIFALAADLIGGMVQCRRILPKDQLNSNPAGWLDVQEPGWRDRLPIYLPEDQGACNRLFNDLLTVEPKARGGGVGLTRVLASTGGSWIEGFVVRADGQLRFDALASQQEGRFRVYFSGSAARLTSREFALIYRSENDTKGNFEVTSQSIGRIGFVGPLPFAETVSVTLGREGSSLPSVPWPGGRSAASACHVLKPTERDDRLELVGHGSVRSTLPSLFVWATAGADIRGHDGGVANCVWKSETRALWRVENMALVTTEDGERYRVHAGAASDDERTLDLETIFAPELLLDDSSVQLVAAPIRVRTIGEAGVSRLRFLRDGREVDARSGAEGLVTVQWLDEEGFVIDRARLLALPGGLNGRIQESGAWISWQNMPRWHVVPVDENGQQMAAEWAVDGMQVPWGGPPVAQQKLRLTDPYGASVLATLSLTASETLLVDATGRIRKDAPEMSPAELRGAVLMADRPATVDLDLRGAGSARALVARRIDGETPMVRFGSLAESLLGLSTERGPSVVIRDDRNRVVCTIRRKQNLPLERDGMVMFADLDDEARVVARSFVRPETEVSLTAVRPYVFQLPDDIDGPHLVYARKGDAVLTRPLLVNVVGNHAAPALTPLQMSGFNADEVERRQVIRVELARIAGDKAAGTEISHLIRLVASLKGLSPRALDVTRELPSCPELLCRLLLAASAERVEPLLALERDLPFLWMALPVEAWTSAARTELDRAVSELSSVLGPEHAFGEAMGQIQKRLATLVERADWFAGVARVLGLAMEFSRPLRSLADDYVRLNHDQQDVVPVKLAEMATELGVPPVLRSFDLGHFPMLLVPLCLAGVACGRLPMTPEMAADIRNALDIDRNYVATAYPHCLAFLRQ